jgi:hypothetical protein
VSRSVAAADCPDWDFANGAPKNHGEYMRAMAQRVKALPEADRDAAMGRYGASACGKPVHAGNPADAKDDVDENTTVPG